MTENKAATVTKLRFLLADDDSKFREFVKEILGESEIISITECGSLSELERLDERRRRFDVCVLDVRFRRQLNQFNAIEKFVRRYSPQCIVVVVSNYVEELSPSQRKAVSAIIRKPALRGDTEDLLKVLIRDLARYKSVPKVVREQAVFHLQRRLASDNPRTETGPSELLEITGSVQQVFGPLVEVLIIGVKVKGVALRPGDRPKKLLMPKTMFAAKEMLAPFTQFRFRYSEDEAGRRIAEVLRNDTPEGEPMVADPELESLWAKEKKRREEGS